MYRYHITDLFKRMCETNTFLSFLLIEIDFDAGQKTCADLCLTSLSFDVDQRVIWPHISQNKDWEQKFETRTNYVL